MIKSKDLPGIITYIEANFEAGLAASTIFSMAAKNFPTYQAQFNYVAAELEGGNSLADSLMQVSLFSEIVIEQIRAGETSGRVPEALASIALITEQSNDIANEFKSALMMPAATLGVALMATIFMAGYVIPKLAESFNMNADGSALVTLCLSLSKLIGENYWVYGVIALSIAGFITYLFNSESVAKSAANATSGSPMLSSYYFSTWASFMSMLQQSGVDIATSVRLCDQLLPMRLASAIKRVFYDVTEVGLDYVDALDEGKFSEKDDRLLIPQSFRIAIKMGGVTGRMDQSLDKTSKRAMKEFSKTIATLTGLTKILIPIITAIPVFLIVYMFFDVFTKGLTQI